MIKKLRKNKLIVDSFWALFGNVIFKGLTLLSGIIVANLLGKQIFGEFSILKSTFVALALFTTFGLGYTATKFVADFKQKTPNLLYGFFLYTQKIVLIFSVIGSILVVFFAKKIAVSVLENHEFEYHFRLISFLVVLNSLNYFYIGFLSGLGLFKKMAKINALIGIITFISTILLTVFFGFNGALIALLLAQSINVIVNYKLIIKNVNTEIKEIDKSTKKRILFYSLPIAVQEAIYSVVTWSISFLIIYLSNYGELGMYSAAIQLNAMILFIPGILRNVILSHLSSASQDDNKYKNILNTVLVINFLATLIPGLIVFLFSEFVAGFYGSSFEGLSGLIKISIFTSVFVSVSNVYAQAYMSKDLNWTMLFFRIIRDLGTILFFIYLVKRELQGAESMIYSKLILSAIFMTIMMLYYKIRLKTKNS